MQMAHSRWLGVLLLGWATLCGQAQDAPPRRFLDRPAAPRDEALYLDGAAAEEEDLVLVDVRSADEWQGTRIPGSLNLRPQEVKVREALRGRMVLLVEQGWNDRRLERVCRDLRARGWAFVAILDGGVAGWLAAGRPVEGTGQGRDQLREIAAAEYLSVRADTDRVVVDAAPTNRAVLHVRDGRAGLDRQLRDMAAMEQATTKIQESTGEATRSLAAPKPCSTCP
jgi:rhodanese-related sulfurtransferase